MEGCGGASNDYYSCNHTSMNNLDDFGDNTHMQSTTAAGVGVGVGGLYSSVAKQVMLINSPPTTTTSSNKSHFLPLPWTTNCTHMRAKIMAHPHFPRLLAAYANCQKVGAPPEVVGRLEEAEAMAMRTGGSSTSTSTSTGVGVGVGVGSLGEDPALDQFMEAYCEMLSKYHQELTKPFKEAMVFLSRVESQFKALTLHHHHHHLHTSGRNGSSSEEADVNDSFIDPHAEDKELKGQLLRRYSGYLGSLKQDFLKKKKKGKLPKEARQQLLEWWSRHYKWPYPSEAQKLALAESTGLDQKQINNWFINQRKRHWKPSEDMQLVVMDAGHNLQYNYMDNVMGNPYPMDFMPTPTTTLL